MPERGAVTQPPPLVVELVGLAGAGKTTVATALSQDDENIHVGPELELRKKVHIPIFVRHLPSLMPFLLPHSRPGRWFTWEEIKAMVYLAAWPSVLKQASKNGTLILLDQGPVFKLATLDAFGPEGTKTRRFAKWSRNIVEQWALTLDIVIWLDAPDAILVERINSRNKKHIVKGRPEQEVCGFLNRYKESYDRVLTNLEASGGPTSR